MAITFDDLQAGDFQPTAIEGGLPKLVRIWEHLRDLNTGGYGGAVLVDVKDAVSKGKSGVTSCSPFTATCIYMALDPRPFDGGQPWSLKEPYQPLFDGGKPLDVNFYRLHNGFSLSSYANTSGKKFAGWKADFKRRYVDRMPQLASDFSAFNFINHSAGSVIALNLGRRVDPKKMRRGDMVGIDWHNGNGHATFCWNVHLDKNGEVDCFQFISSNGTSAHGGAGITIFRYPDVDPAYLEKSGGKYTKKKDMFSGVIDDPRAYAEYTQKPYWWFGLPGVKKGDIDLDTFGVPAKTVQISYADSIDVSVHVVHVARLNGVTPPEPYLRADGGESPEPQESSKPSPLTKVKSKKADGGAQAAQQGQADQPKMQPEKAPPGQPHPVQADVEANLAMLWMTRWISKDPGDPKSVNDSQTQAALRDYQEKYMKGDVPKLGHADPKTRQRLARTAATAMAMPMVSAALALAHERGVIESAPGPNAMRLDDATRAAVKEFQKKKGLDADGIPGHDTQEKLSAYMKEAAKAQPAPQQEAKAGEPPAKILLFYFTRNHGPAGKPVTLKVATTPACNGKTFSVSLFKDGKELVKSAGQITVSAGQGTVDLNIPEDIAPGSAVMARLSEDGLRAETSAPFYVIGTGGTPATLTILAADGTAGHDPGKLRLGAGNGLQLKWSVTGATKATLTAKPLVQNACEASDKPSGAAHVSNDHLVSSGVDLPLDAQGSGSGTVLVDPGPCGSTEYTVSVTPKSGAPVAAKATAFVANFNVQIELPDGSDYARNKSCVLEIPGREPVQGTTNQCGELWLWLPNVTAESATLRLLDGGKELASWTVAVGAEEGVPSGALALNDAPAGGSAA